MHFNKNKLDIVVYDDSEFQEMEPDWENFAEGVKKHIRNKDVFRLVNKLARYWGNPPSKNQKEMLHEFMVGTNETFGEYEPGRDGDYSLDRENVARIKFLRSIRVELTDGKDDYTLASIYRWDPLNYFLGAYLDNDYVTVSTSGYVIESYTNVGFYKEEALLAAIQITVTGAFAMTDHIEIPAHQVKWNPTATKKDHEAFDLCLETLAHVVENAEIGNVNYGHVPLKIPKWLPETIRYAR